jgi:hypothetical protein
LKNNVPKFEEKVPKFVKEKNPKFVKEKVPEF